MRISSLPAAALIAFSLSSHADTQVSFAVQQGQQVDTISFYVRNQQVLGRQSADTRNDFVFDAQSKTLTILDHSRRTFTTLDQASVTQMANMVESVGDLARSQGGVIGDLFSSLGLESDLGERSEIAITQKNETINIAGLACQVSEVTEDKVLKTRLCLRDSLPIDSKEANTLNQLIEFAQNIAKQAGGVLQSLGLIMPVLPQDHITQFIIGADLMGENQAKARLTEIKTAQLVDEDFIVPAGYQEKSLPL